MSEAAARPGSSGSMAGVPKALGHRSGAGGPDGSQGVAVGPWGRGCVALQWPGVDSEAPSGLAAAGRTMAGCCRMRSSGRFHVPGPIWHLQCTLGKKR